ncbi:MAG: alpha-galactosidase [Lachnospiraceae bacterium]|nr:alpha-galactosidase [Lachnospiraceae bacterium]
MAIIYHEESRIFDLHTDHTTYQMQVDSHRILMHLYYGRKIEGATDYLIQYYDRGFSANVSDAGNDRTYSLDCLPQEYPCSGTGDFRSPAIRILQDTVDSCDLRYVSHEIRQGKYSLKGLPAVYASDDEAQTLDVVLEDQVVGMRVHLLYGVLPAMDIITRSVIVQNTGTEWFELDRVLTANLDFVCGDYDLLTFYGRHGMERNLSRNAVSHSSQMICSRRGMSSHQQNPMMILAAKDTTERAGLCYSMQFVYSGGFMGVAEKDQFNLTRMQLGLMEEKFSWPMKPGGEFVTPEVIMSCSTAGFSVLTRNIHRCIRKHLCRGPWRDRVRPVLLNSWEAFYADFDNEKVLELAREAKSLNMDMLVLDDGWFGKRDDDNSGLGDWYVNEEKLGGTLGELSRKIHGMGLMFGIWVEPEMVNEDSDLYREHPDWAMTIPGREPVRGRNQLVLDFSREDVLDEIFERICRVLDEGRVDYLKWDYNRSISDVYSAVQSHQGVVLYDYILGLYDFLERLNRRYPDMLIEGCSGGGGRFDAGMMYYTPQIWCSDNTDAIDRLRIQYGTSFGYPAAVVGAHVSAVPNEQCGRVTPLKTRGVVAMSGSGFGYELNPSVLSEEEKEEIRGQIREYRRFAPLVLSGDVYRLSNPVTDRVAAWMFVSEDRSEALVNAVATETHFNQPVSYVRLMGLDPDAVYCRDDGREYPAGALMEAGLPVPIEKGEYRCYQVYLRKKKETPEGEANGGV